MRTKVSFGMLTLVTVCMTLMSCDRNRIFDAYVSVPQNGWNKDSLAYFVVNNESVEQPMNFIINIRNTPQYPNSNLWLFIDVKSPSGKIERDTVECALADVQGKWLGKGWGSIYQVQVPYKKFAKLGEHGEYEFKFSHGMRSPDLKGIYDIGLRVEKAR